MICRYDNLRRYSEPKNLALTQVDTAGEIGQHLVSWACDGQSGKARCPCAGTRLLIQPCDDAHNIERHRDHNMLEARFGQPGVAGSSQIAPAHTLRKTAFDASTCGILLLEFGCLLPHARRLERLVLLSWANGQAARAALGFGTLGSTLTSAAVFGVERNPNAGVALRITARRPLARELALRTARLLCVPVKRQVRYREALIGLRLPG